MLGIIADIDIIDPYDGAGGRESFLSPSRRARRAINPEPHSF